MFLFGRGCMGAALSLCASALWAVPSLTVRMDLSSPRPAGTTVTFMADASGFAGPLTFRFEKREVGGTWRIIRDYMAFPALQWTTIDTGFYEIRVSARGGGSSVSSVVPFQFASRVTGTAAVLSAMDNPLVFLYSAPPCSTGSLRVRFALTGTTSWQTTPARPCQPDKSLSFELAGLRARRQYLVQQEQVSGTGNVTSGPFMTLTTKALDLDAMPRISTRTYGVLNMAQPVLLQSYFGYTRDLQVPPIATDLSGEVIWYYKALDNPTMQNSYMARPIPGGNMLIILRIAYAVGQILREIDLAGNTVRETSASRISEQLLALGKDPINWLHHDAVRLPNGHTLVLGAVEKILVNEQSRGPVDVVGDMLIDLDEDLQVAWTWNAFDFLDHTRKAILNETCENNFICGPLYYNTQANDWTHTNAIDFTPDDGNLIVSMRHQDWVLKLSYQNGTGDGHIIWKFGNDGDFLLDAQGLWPWFSHAHDAHFDGGSLVIYDNGNTRVGVLGSGSSRGQVYLLDENGRTAKQILNADLGSYSLAFGSGQLLSNGNYLFGSGTVGNQSIATEVRPSGATSYTMTSSSVAYRVFRMADLYHIQ